MIHWGMTWQNMPAAARASLDAIDDLLAILQPKRSTLQSVPLLEAESGLPEECAWKLCCPGCCCSTGPTACGAFPRPNGGFVRM